MFISVIALAMSMMAMATETAYVEIQLTGTTGGANSIYLFEDDAYTNAFESGADVEKIMSQSNNKSVLLYGFVGSTPCEDVVALNLDGLVLGFSTNQVDQNYRLSFIDVEGRALTLYDRVTKVSTPITDGTYLDFSVTAAQVGRVAINDRFVINYEAPTTVFMEGDFDNPDGGGAWIASPDFTNDGTSYSVTMTMEADAWYHFQMKERYGSTEYVGANGSAFDRTNNFYYIPVDGWHDQLTLHTDVAGTYTFTWNDLTDNLTITFPAVAPANTVTTNAYGFCSFASTQSVEFLGGLKAYRGQYNAGTNELTLYEIGTQVPANTGVILWNSNGTAETFNYNTGVAAPTVSDNDFVGVTTAADPAGIRTAGKEIYCLNGNALKQYVGTDEIPAGKAYLPISVGGGSNNAPKHIVMRFNGTTAVDNVEAESVKAEKFVENGQVLIRRGNEVYNLQGQIVK